MLEPASPAEAYKLVGTAFELSESTGSPVFVRLTTAVALGHTLVETEDPVPPKTIEPILEKDITRYTKAGSKICLDQHQALINRLNHAGQVVREMRLNRIELSKEPGGVGIVLVGSINAYILESLKAVDSPSVSVLGVKTTIPFPWEETKRLLAHCEKILVLEELEPHVERAVYTVAQQLGFDGPIVGKLDGTLSPIGEYGLTEIQKGLAACGLSPVASGENLQITSHALQADDLSAPRPITVCAGAGSSPSATSPNGEPSTTVLPSRVIEAPQERHSAVLASTNSDENGLGAVPAPRPITVCAGCPHRGTYLAIEAAIKQAGFSKDEVMVTGDIGCTILGMNPPFNLLWNEVSMGTSISLAQGYVHAGLKTPVIATMGDSTFFHGGIPGLINAIQHQVPLTLVVMDNGWTSMTGMQVNAGTEDAFQPEDRRVDIEAVIRGLGPDRVEVANPFDLDAMTAILTSCLEEPSGVKVVLAQQECAIQAKRRGIVAGYTTIDSEKCILCKKCLQVTGCPALGISSADEMLEESSSDASDSSRRRHVTIDLAQCNGCGLCVHFCPTGALGNSRAKARELLREESTKADPSLGSDEEATT